METKAQEKKTRFRVTQRVRGGTGKKIRAFELQISVSRYHLCLFQQNFIITILPPTKHTKLFVLSMQESLPTLLVSQPGEFLGTRGNWDVFEAGKVLGSSSARFL